MTVQRPPHPAAISPRGAVQPKATTASRRPHPATVPHSGPVQLRAASVKRPPHPATVGQPQLVAQRSSERNNGATLVVMAVNAVLKSLGSELKIASIEDDKQSDVKLSCNDFASGVLNHAANFLKVDPEALVAREFKVGEALPDKFEGGTLVNISTLGEPSSLNHNFNVFFANDTAYVLQEFLEQSVPVIKKHKRNDFFSLWSKLSGNTWMDAYKQLFGADPGTAAGDAKLVKEKSWLASQWVTPLKIQ